MIGRDFIEENIELKRFISTPFSEKPRFDWKGIDELGDTSDTIQIKVEIGGGERKEMDVTQIAETIGEALTDLFLARKQEKETIFNDHNRGLVARVSRQVADELELRSRDQGEEVLTLTADELTHLIERALIRNNAYDIATSLIMRRHTVLGQNKERLTNREVSKLLHVKVIRRNGKAVPWNQNKIEIAVRKAFLSLHLDSDSAKGISSAVTNRVASTGKEYIHIEDLQDMVQEELMLQGHFKVAEAYILYRAHRARMRELEVEQEKEEAKENGAQEALILVKRDDETTFLWDGIDLRKRIEFALIGLDLLMDEKQIEQELRRSLFPEMKLSDLRKTIILNAKSLIEKDADFSKFAARILLSYIYEEVMEWNIVEDGIQALPQFHREAFKKNLVQAVQIGRINPQLLDYEIDKLAEAIDSAADLDFDFLGIQTLYDRYLIVDKTVKPSRRLETPQLFWMRVAMGLFMHEEERTQKIIDLYKLYKGRRFCSSTPTLFNSGTLHSQLSSCYLYKVDDSIESIMYRGISENAFLSKWAGGLGGSWTAVRGTGSYIQGTNGESQGVIPFLKLHNDQLVAVNQGGKRRGSGCAYLETWHNDIADFLELRKNTGDDRRRTHDMNTANWIPDLFMKRMEARGSWVLFRSNEVTDLHDLYGSAFEKRYLEYEKKVHAGEMYGKVLPALDLWKQMLRMLFETGHPWMTFKDTCNVRSPQDHAGVIHSSNLCTEITLNTSGDETAVCNLGSVVLDSHIDETGALDHEKLRETVRIAVRALDNVIDINFYPTKAAENSNRRHRPIGLGVMGLQNCLYKKHISFASQEAIEFNDEFMEAVAYYAYEASSDLAQERGSYSSYQGSKWDRGLLPQDTLDLLEQERGVEIPLPREGKMDWHPLREKIAQQGMRNSNVLAIAPTATISNIMGSSPCIEPAYKNLFVKSNLSGDFIVLNQFLVRDLKMHHLWNQEMIDQLKYHDGELHDIQEIPRELKEKYRTAFGIDYHYFIEAAARRQKWIDQSQSVNLFLEKPDLKTLSHMYRAAWRNGLKTTYYLRTLGASNIEKATISVKKEVRGHIASVEEKKKEYTPEEKMACSIEAMLNGEECEACQ